MKAIITITLILLALTACTVSHTSEASDPAATAVPQAGIPNPASVYCTEHGNQSEIRTAADGSQSGVCIFPDGNTCDEWAYFRGECGSAANSPMPAETLEEITDWWGVIKSLDPGGQYDDYFERQDLGETISYGVDSIDPTVSQQIDALRDTGKIVHLFGTLFSNLPDYNGSQIQVDRIEVD
jgi:putative hemolysin